MTTQTKIQDIPRSADAGTLPGPDNPPGYPPTWPRYSPEELMGEIYFGLWSAGVIPPGPMVDPQGAIQSAAALLRSFGVTPTDVPAAGPQLTAAAVARVCAVAA